MNSYFINNFNWVVSNYQIFQYSQFFKISVMFKLVVMDLKKNSRKEGDIAIISENI